LINGDDPVMPADCGAGIAPASFFTVAIDISFVRYV
jgi:hypothetical protein